MAARFLGGDENSSIPYVFPDCVLQNCTGICFDGACLLDAPPPHSDDVFPLDVQHKSRLLSTFLISAASLIAFSFLLLLLFYFLIRLRRRRLHQPHQQPPPPLDPDHDGVPLENDDDDDTPHHVWLIRTVGVDETVIKSIAAAVYKAGDGLVDGGDCAVCLGEFVDGEVVKILPKCSHAFHLSCIDTWLRSHVNCPLCRAPVVAAPAADSAPSDNTQIEIPPPPPPIQEVDCEVAIDLEAGSSSSGPLGDSAEDESEVQPIRRSVSMDSSSLGMLMLRVESEPEEEKLGEEKNEVELQTALAPKSNKGKGVDSLGKHPGLVEMKRSLSSRSGRMFFSRYMRGRSTSILPL